MNILDTLPTRQQYGAYSAWLNNQTRVHHFVSNYLGMFPQDLNDGNTTSPKTWSFISESLYVSETMDPILLKMLLGSEAKARFDDICSVLRTQNCMPTYAMLAEILEGTRTYFPTYNDMHQHLIIRTLCEMLAERADVASGTNDANARIRWLKHADNFLEFIMANFSDEVCVIGGKIAISVYRLPFETQKMKNFDAFAKKYRHLIMGA